MTVKVYWSPVIGANKYALDRGATTASFSTVAWPTASVPGPNYDQGPDAFFYNDSVGTTASFYRVAAIDTLGTTGSYSDPFQVGSSYVASLTTVTKVKEYLGITTSTDDSLLARLVAASSRWFTNQCGRDIAYTIYVDTVDGNGEDVMLLKNSPVSAITSVSVDGVVIPVRPSLTGSGYVFNTYSVILAGYEFTEGLQNVQIVYEAGLSPVPEDVEQAVIELVALKYRERSHVGNASQTLAGTSVSFLPSMVPQAVKDVVELYRRPSF